MCLFQREKVSLIKHEILFSELLVEKYHCSVTYNTAKDFSWYSINLHLDMYI